MELASALSQTAVLLTRKSRACFLYQLRNLVTKLRFFREILLLFQVKIELVSTLYTNSIVLTGRRRALRQRCIASPSILYKIFSLSKNMIIMAKVAMLV
jgi:hypothetical protein